MLPNLKPLSLFLPEMLKKIYKPIPALLVIGLLGLYIYLASFSIGLTVNADMVAPLSLYIELKESFSNLSAWNFSDLTFLFPDIILIFLISPLVSLFALPIEWTNFIYGLVQCFSFVLVSTLIIQKALRLSILKSTQYITLSFLLFIILAGGRFKGLISYLLPLNTFKHLFLNIMTVPVIHFSAIIISLFIIYLLFLGLETIFQQPFSYNQGNFFLKIKNDSKLKIIITCASLISLLITFSDPLYLFFGSLPIFLSCWPSHNKYLTPVITLSLFRIRNKKFDQLFAFFYGIITFSASLLGYILYKILGFAPPNSNIGLDKTLSSIQNFISASFNSPLIICILFSCISFIAIYTKLIFLGKQEELTEENQNALDKSVKNFLEKPCIVYLFQFLVYSNFVTFLTAVVLFGAFTDAGSVRYVLPLVYLLPISLAASFWSISSQKNLKKGRKFTALLKPNIVYLLILFLISGQTFLLASDQFPIYTPSKNPHYENYTCLQKLKIDRYVAEFWDAKPIHILSQGRIKPIQVTRSADFYHWLNSDRWFKPEISSADRVAILIKEKDQIKMDPQEASKKFGFNRRYRCGKYEYLVNW